MKESIKRHIYVIVSLLIGAAVGGLAVLNPFYALDSYITDKLYTRLTGPSSDIIIIGIDEETLAEYGNFNLWSREKSAKLLEYLYEDMVNSPRIVGLDIMYTGEYEKETDLSLASAAEMKRDETGSDRYTVTASNVVYRGTLIRDDDGSIRYDTANISDVEIPYRELAGNSRVGFTNACIASDGCVRYAMDTVRVSHDITERYDYSDDFNSDIHHSFDRVIYELCYGMNGDHTGAGYSPDHPDRVDDSYRLPFLYRQSDDGMYRFIYSGKTGEFQHVSMRAVLAGEIPHEAFRDRIVLVGAYAPGFQDAYTPAVDRGSSMYGVEIHANIIQALMEHKTMLPMNSLWLWVLTAAITAGFLIFVRKRRLSLIMITSGVIASLYIILGRLLGDRGIMGRTGYAHRMFIPCVYILLFLVLTDVYFVIEKYIIERIRRRATLDVFKKYVAPEIVDSLSRSGDFELKLGGESRDVAVLFVDIRGFTPLSEGLEPEKVVAILNEYLKLTTTCILKHRGTLDKFIGDATMAVFGAPFDMDDYVYEAVAAAWDIKEGSKELGDRLYEEYGRRVGFGVGVNCGKAVVGNIGCDFRMDYTAIGDTVNTASRLESNAKAEQILISESVYERLRGRIKATPIGEIPLKGKSNKIMVYSVESIMEGSIV